MDILSLLVGIAIGAVVVTGGVTLKSAIAWVEAQTAKLEADAAHTKAVTPVTVAAIQATTAATLAAAPVPVVKV